MTTRVKGALFLVLAFVLGAAAGTFGFGLYQARTGWWRQPRDPARFQQLLVNRLTRTLELRPEQRQEVEAILGKTGQEFAGLREEIGPRVRAIRERSRERIRAVLDPAQQGKFEAWAEEWGRRGERWRGRAWQPEGRGSGGP
ncbi:MAG: hypothetical protein HY713_03195 [candidate division NC10 bacterium]|nr:hypothetical protein [candidate division NC10 bacterium]